MIDSEGFRPNVGIIVANQHEQVLWARRARQADSWQFPQGGIQRDETPEQALYRELHEETGLEPEHVRLVAWTRGWLRYHLPRRLVRQGRGPTCIGQKQKWALLLLTGDEKHIQFDHTDRPEFDGFNWVSYWYPLNQVISFKREVYRRAMLELAPPLFQALNSESHA